MDVKRLSQSPANLQQSLTLLEMPTELIEEILSYLSFDQIAQNRLICRSLNKCCSQLLNRGFMKVEKFHGQCLKKVKSQLPRRESERRAHPLSRHCEILSAIETRLSLLSMTYMRYVESNMCCFIPGKVVDEIYRVLRFVQNNPNPPRIAELLQELRDISSMAMEYFEERIVPRLKSNMSSPTALFASVSSVRSSITYAGYRPSLLSLSTPSSGNFFGSVSSTPTTIDLVDETESRSKNQSFKSFSAFMRKETANIKTKTKESEKQMQQLQQLINTRLAEQNSRIEELTQKVVELEKRNNSMLSDSKPISVKTQRNTKKVNPVKKATTSRARHIKQETPVMSIKSEKMPFEPRVTRSTAKRKLNTEKTVVVAFPKKSRNSN